MSGADEQDQSGPHAPLLASSRPSSDPKGREDLTGLAHLHLTYLRTLPALALRYYLKFISLRRLVHMGVDLLRWDKWSTIWI
jgi:hypothetical protein